MFFTGNFISVENSKNWIQSVAENVYIKFIAQHWNIQSNNYVPIWQASDYFWMNLAAYYN